MAAMTDEQVEAEIARIRASEDYKLARKYNDYRNRRRQMLYNLRSVAKQGRELRKAGFTLDNLHEMMEEEYDD